MTDSCMKKKKQRNDRDCSVNKYKNEPKNTE